MAGAECQSARAAVFAVFSDVLLFPSMIWIVFAVAFPPLRSRMLVRMGLPASDLPVDGLAGIDLQRKLQEVTYSELSAADGADAARLRSDGPRPARLARQSVTVSSYYGVLTRGNEAGTRVFCKAYSSAQPQGVPTEPTSSSTPPDALAALEAALASDGRSAPSLAAEMADNEFAAHTRLQKWLQAESALTRSLGSSVRGGGETRPQQVRRLLGRLRSATGPDGARVILLVFLWGWGEQVRMALPTRAPPTVASWLVSRTRGDTPSSKMWDRSVPLRAARQRGKFVRAVTRDALQGLACLHAAGVVHGGLTPACVLISTDDDRRGEAVSAQLGELAFAREARSLAAVCRADAMDEAGGEDKSADPLGTGLAERAKQAGAGSAAERVAFGEAEDVFEFGMLLLVACIVGCAPPAPRGVSGSTAGSGPASELGLRSLAEGAFGGRKGGVEVGRLREYLEAEDGLRLGGSGGVELLSEAPARPPAPSGKEGGMAGGMAARLRNAGGGERGRGGWEGSGWSLLEQLLGPWRQRPTAAEALRHGFWE